MGKTRDRVRRDFVNFCDINGLEEHDAQSLLPFIGQMLQSKLSAGTVNRYVIFVASLINKSDLKWEILRAVSKAHGDADTRGARPFSMKELTSFLAQLKAHRTVIYLMAATGWRSIDIRRLRHRQITVLSKHYDNDHIMIEARWTKTINSPVNRRTAVFPLISTVKSLPDDVLAEIQQGPPDGRLGDETAYWEIMKEIKAFAVYKSTYSIRYLFINWALDHFKGDVHKVAHRFTLHRDVKMLEAFYIDWKKAFSANLL